MLVVQGFSKRPLLRPPAQQDWEDAGLETRSLHERAMPTSTGSLILCSPLTSMNVIPSPATETAHASVTLQPLAERHTTTAERRAKVLGTRKPGLPKLSIKLKKPPRVPKWESDPMTLFVSGGDSNKANRSMVELSDAHPNPGFMAKTQQRVASHYQEVSHAARLYEARKREEATKYQHVDTEAFLLKTKERAEAHMEAVVALKPGQRPPRVAIIGAGPVGLWNAILISRAHARLALGNGVAPPRIQKLPSAPVVDVFEQRVEATPTPQGACRQQAAATPTRGIYGTRRIVLAISSATQDLLNGQLLSAQSLTASHQFAPTCSINTIEQVW